MILIKQIDGKKFKYQIREDGCQAYMCVPNCRVTTGVRLTLKDGVYKVTLEEYEVGNTVIEETRNKKLAWATFLLF